MQKEEAVRGIGELSEEMITLLNSTATNRQGRSAGIVTDRVGNCDGSNYYQDKYCGEILTIRRQIAKHQETIDAHNAYMGVAAAKNMRLEEVASLDLASANITSHLHPIFIGLATLFNSKGNLIKYYFFIVSSILCEFIGSFSLVLFSRLRILDSDAQSAPSGVQQSEWVVKTSPPQVSNLRLERKSDLGNYPLIVEAIRSGQLNNLSYKGIIKFAKKNNIALPQASVKIIRQKLVDDGHAALDSTRKLVNLLNKPEN